MAAGGVEARSICSSRTSATLESCQRCSRMSTLSVGRASLPRSYLLQQTLTAYAFPSRDDLEAGFEFVFLADAYDGEWPYMISRSVLTDGKRNLDEILAPLCRWILDNVTVDVRPVEEGVLGFSNPWYASAFENASEFRSGEQWLLLIDAPHFLATKVVAFQGRGRGDFLGSKGIEDVIAVVDGRAAIAAEVGAAGSRLRALLSQTFETWLETHEFQYVVEGYIQDEEREAIVVGRFRQIVTATH